LPGILINRLLLFTLLLGVSNFLSSWAIGRPSDTIENFPAGRGPIALAFDGSNIWVVNVYGETVTKLRASDGVMLGSFGTGVGPVDAVFDGENIWVSNNQEDTLTKLRASDGAQLGVFAAGDGPTGTRLRWIQHLGGKLCR
jgi:DNA-binding beta-propeller fold protein YncE